MDEGHELELFAIQITVGNIFIHSYFRLHLPSSSSYSLL